MAVCFKKLKILNLEYAKFKAESDMELSQEILSRNSEHRDFLYCCFYCLHVVFLFLALFKIEKRFLLHTA